MKTLITLIVLAAFTSASAEGFALRLKAHLYERGYSPELVNKRGGPVVVRKSTGVSGDSGLQLYWDQRVFGTPPPTEEELPTLEEAKLILATLEPEPEPEPPKPALVKATKDMVDFLAGQTPTASTNTPLDSKEFVAMVFEEWDQLPPEERTINYTDYLIKAAKMSLLGGDVASVKLADIEAKAAKNKNPLIGKDK